MLEMDHYCPWILNVIGFNNRKYFFLLLFYTTIVLDLYVIFSLDQFLEATKRMVRPAKRAPARRTQSRRARRCRSTSPSTPCFRSSWPPRWYVRARRRRRRRAVSPAAPRWQTVVLNSFFFFHCWLVANNFTTIEYCEKRRSSKADVRDLYSTVRPQRVAPSSARARGAHRAGRARSRCTTWVSCTTSATCWAGTRCCGSSPPTSACAATLPSPLARSPALSGSGRLGDGMHYEIDCNHPMARCREADVPVVQSNCLGGKTPMPPPLDDAVGGDAGASPADNDDGDEYDDRV